MRSTAGMPRPPFVPGSVFRAARIVAGMTQQEIGEEIDRDRRSIGRLESKGGFLTLGQNTSAGRMAHALAKRGVIIDGRTQTIQW